jgi:cytochrome b subunit of formate dehydrogenase
MIPFGCRGSKFSSRREIIHVFRNKVFYIFFAISFPEQLTILFFRKKTAKRTPQENLRWLFKIRNYFKNWDKFEHSSDLLLKNIVEMRKLQDQTSP